MIIEIIVTFLTFAFSKQQCNIGCLVCTTTNNCLLCDFTNSFYLNSTTCTSKKISGCQIANPIGGCLACEAGFYFDLTTKVCLRVSTSFLTANCTYYSPSQICTTCQSGFFFQRGVCVAVTNITSNCVAYSSNGICSQCSSEFVPAIGGASCLQVNQVNNCSAYNVVNCTLCNSGYYLNQNYYLSVAYTSPQSWATFMFPDSSKSIQLSSAQICQPTIVANCITFSSYDNCVKCVTGFYLSAGTCIMNPISPIANCIVYKTINLCLTCSVGFSVSSTGGCSTILPITNCVAYNNSANFVQCTQCNSGFFIQSNVNCQPRQNSINITNCLVVSPISDTCSVCVVGFNLTGDMLACLPSSPFCAVYATSTFQSQALLCSSCVNGYFLSLNQCLQGTITNCTTYSSMANFCVVCASGSYAFAGNCTLQPNISQCSVYSPTTNATCSVCNSSNSFAFQYQSVCSPVTLVPFCQSYGVNGVCLSCITGYFLFSNACIQFSNLLPNCISATYISGTFSCTGCVSGYVFSNALKVCDLPFQYITDSCLTPSLTGSSYDLSPFATCITCVNGAVGFDFNNHFVCVEVALLPYTSALTMVPNCIKLRSSGGCLRCDVGFVLTSTFTCAATCPLTFVTYLVDYQTSSALYCGLQSAIPNCALILKVSPSAFRCVQIASGFSALVTLSDTQVIPYILSETNVNPTFFNYQGFGVTPVTISSPIAYCSVYFTVSSVTYCLSCNFGYTSILTGGFITACVEMADCQPTFYSGLSQQLNQFLSCHSCTSSLFIPIIFVQGSTTGFTQTAQPSGFTYGVACSSIPVNIDPNCSILFNLVNPTTSAQNGVYCGACQPNYSPVFTANTVIVTQCVLIPNCLNGISNFFNGCLRCAPGFAHLISSNVVNTASCVTSNSLNCLVATNTGSCSICIVGFVLNLDGICEPFLMHFCLPGNSQPYQAILLSNFQLFSFFIYFSETAGCLKCEINFVALQRTTATPLCTPSRYIANKFLPSSTVYIPNCQFYNLNPNPPLLCFQCNPGFIVTANNQTCVPSLPNCLIAVSAGACQTCVSNDIGFILSGGACIPYNVSNCNIFAPTTTTVPLCLVCVNGYYLVNSTTCLPGNIIGCVSYANGSPIQCLACDLTYQLVGTGSNAACFPIDKTLNCVSYDSSLFNQGILSCLSCAPNNSLNVTLAPYSVPNLIPIKSYCMNFTLLSNCAAYQVTTLISSSNFQCKACVPGFYFNQTILSCVARNYNDTNCATFNPTSDTCIVCTNVAVLNANGTGCIPMPSGIPGCLIYSSSTTCAQCLSNFFINLGKCTNVKITVSNCAIYSADGVCSVCISNYFPSSGSCVQANAQNCLTFADINTCTTCASNMVIQVTGTITNCIAFNIVNCLSFNQTTPFNCLSCLPGFYPSGPTCVLVPTVIANCISYLNASVCLVCAPNNVLSQNGTQCLFDAGTLSLVDSNCQSSNILPENKQVCSICRPGFYMSSGQCVKCPSSAQGCYLCDPNNAFSCSICSPGFSMNSTRQCYSSGLVPTNFTTNSTNSEFIFRSFSVILITGLLLQ